MPNRILKESICTSDTIENLNAPANAETFFYRLIVNCEDYGRFDARPAILRAKTYPLRVDKINLLDVEEWLKRLHESGLIILYSNNGRPYLEMTTWHNHQQIRASKSKFPGIDDEGSVLISNDINCNQEKTGSTEPDRTRIRISNTNTITNTITDAKKQKVKYAEFVSMTEDEHQKLIDKFGETLTKEKIEDLSLWKGSKGKKTASDFLTILNWDRREKKNKPFKNPPPDPINDYDKGIN